MSLRRRILLAVLPLVLLLLALGAGGVALLRNLGTHSDAILLENYDSIRAMVLLDAAVDRIQESLRERNAAFHDRAWNELREQLRIEQNNITIFPDEPRLVAELEAAVDDYGRTTRATLNGTSDIGESDRASKVVKARSAAVRELNQATMEDANREARRVARWSLIGFVIAFLVALASAALLGFHLAARITQPIRSLTAAVEAIRTGDLTYRVPEGSGDELGLLANTFNDMAEQLWLIKQTNYAQLARARETAQATIDSFPSPVLVVDPERRIELANPAARRLFGVGAGRSAWEPPDALRAPLLDALRDHRPFLTERFEQSIAFRLDNEDRAFLPQIRPIRGDRGDTIGAAIVLDDVTQFRLLDQLKGDFVATASHELKTPLASLRLALHLLLEETVGSLNPKQTELMIDARENSERLFHLIERLLALAKLEDSHELLAVESCRVPDLFRAAADNLTARAVDKSVSIRLEDTGELPPVVVDPVRLGNALDNLLTNALAYTPAGGTISLTALLESDRVRLTVADTGVGIPAEYLPNVFDKFFRVPGDGRPPGTGLGLAIVREVVEAHGGAVACESEVGAGTKFHLSIPVWKGGEHDRE